MKIFVCDDDKDILEFLETLLSEFGYQVRVTLTSENAIELLREFNPDLMIFDYWLNGDRSDKIIEEIKQYKEFTHIPIILISAIADLDSVAKDIPIDDYMKKPFDIHDLQYKIKKIVNYV